MASYAIMVNAAENLLQRGRAVFVGYGAFKEKNLEILMQSTVKWPVPKAQALDISKGPLPSDAQNTAGSAFG